MLRIGIDATAIPHRERVGAGNYIFDLVRALAGADTQNEYFVFAKPVHIEEWRIKQANFNLIPGGSSKRPLRLLWEQTALAGLCRRYQIDVLHSPHYTAPILGRSRSVVTFCDAIFFSHPELHTLSKRLLFRQMMKLAVRRAAAIIAISTSTARDLVRLFEGRLQPERVHVTTLAARNDFRQLNDAAGIRRICHKHNLQAGLFVLYVGALEPRKNVPILLRAFRDLVDRGFQQRLAIVGRRGWMFKDIYTTTQALKLEGKVIFTGHVPNEELPYLYNGARLFAYPSLYEGFGLPVLEAMACGAPVVTSNISSMPEIVGEAGLLVDPYDQMKLTEAMERLIVDDDLNHALRQQGVRRAAEFSWERTARETLKVYSAVCEGRD
jgi:glycosyltransferase involved in cell wall biosynthesis